MRHILLVLLPLLAVSCSALKLNAFNIQVFGQAKMDKPEVVQVLLDILEQDDIILIQEIRDAQGTAIIELFDLLNDRTGNAYEMVISERLGSTSSKEQNAFFYKPALVSVVDEFQVPINYNEFERSPYIVTFNAPGTSIGTFAFLGTHVKPDEAVRENDLMAEVYDRHRSGNGGEVPTDDWVFGGDFNADCSYVGAGDWENIRLWTDSRFTWIIPNSADTTVSATDCAYDRFVLSGRATTFGGSGSVYYFDADLNIDNELALDTSDHYPVLMVLS